MDREDTAALRARLSQELDLRQKVKPYSCSRCQDLFYVAGAAEGEAVCSACRRLQPLIDCLNTIHAAVVELREVKEKKEC